MERNNVPSFDPAVPALSQLDQLYKFYVRHYKQPAQRTMHREQV